MIRFAIFALAALIAAGTSLAGSGKAAAGDLGVIAYVVAPGVCGESWVLRAITSRFRYQVRHVPNLPDVGIVAFHDIYENRYIPADATRLIARSYCGARVALSDGDDRDIWYLIEGHMGFAGVGRNVEFCVSGFDRWYVYNGRCRILR